MPGRRTPRKPHEAMLNQHSRAAFAGGMDGKALVPVPVGLGLGLGKDKGSGRKDLLFRQDAFTGDGSTHTFQLTYRPLPHSERVFLDGMYCREGQDAVWTPADGTTGTSVKFLVPPQAGELIVVEYAHYAAAPAPVPTWAGVYYGPWLDGPTTSGQLMQPKVHTGYSGTLNGAPNPTYLALGDGTTGESSTYDGSRYEETEKNASNNSDLQYASCHTSYIWPGYYTFSGHQWSSSTSVHHPVRDGIKRYEPTDQMTGANPRAVGWDFGSVQFFNSSRCSGNGLSATYNTWRSDPAGQNPYRIYLETTPIGPIIPGTGSMTVWYRIAFLDSDRYPQPPTPYGHTVLVGTAAGDYRITPATYKTTVFKDRIYADSVLTDIRNAQQITRTTNSPSNTPYTGTQFTLNFLPDAIEYPFWGRIRAPAYRHVEAPGTIFPNEFEPTSGLLGNGFSVQACLDFKCYGYAKHPPYRLIYAR
jgi:hypothetical protein